MSVVMNSFILLIFLQLFLFIAECSLRRINTHSETRLFLFKSYYLFFLLVPFLFYLPELSEKQTFIKIVEIEKFASLSPVLSSRITNFNWINVGAYAYLIISFSLLIRLISNYLYLRLKLTRGGKSIIFNKKVFRTSHETPFCFGLLKPEIYWPKSLDLSEKKQEAIFIHEKNHCQSFDPLWLFYSKLIGCFLWPSPFSYWIEKRFSLVIEEFCDYRTLIETQIKPKEYGEILLDLTVEKGCSSLMTSINQTDLMMRIQTLTYSRMKKMKSMKAFFLLVICMFTYGVMAVKSGKAPNLENKSLVQDQLYEIDQFITIESANNKKENLKTRVILKEGLEGKLEVSTHQGTPFYMNLKVVNSTPWIKNTLGTKIKLKFRMERDEEFMNFDLIPTELDKKHQVTFYYGPDKQITMDYTLKKRKQLPQ